MHEVEDVRVSKIWESREISEQAREEGEIISSLHCRSLKSNFSAVTVNSAFIRAILSVQNTLLALLPIWCIHSSPNCYKFFRSQLGFHFL